MDDELRTEVSTSPNFPPDFSRLPRSEDLWLHDGNIVLATQDFAFKVYRGILEHHSVVFRDMFSLPQPPNQETLDGHLVVVLPDDTDDVVCMLSALHFGGKKYFYADVPIPFATVSAMLRIGMKYEIANLRDEGIRLLQHCFPSSFPKLKPPKDMFTDFPGHEEAMSGRPLEVHPEVLMITQDAMAVVDLAERFNLQNLLPVAFYYCAQCTHDQMVQGVVEKRWSLRALVTCLDGMTSLRQTNISNIKALLSGELSHLCDTEEECHSILRDVVYDLSTDSVLTAPLPLEPWADRISCYRICDPCGEHLKEEHEGCRRATWNILGEYFGVSPWPLAH